MLPLRVMPVAAALTLGLAAPSTGQTPLDSSLYQYIKRIKAIDNHAHPMLAPRAAEPADSDFDALPLSGIPAFPFPVRLRGDNPELIEAWRDLYDYPHADRSDQHLADLRERKARIKQQQADG